MANRAPTLMTGLAFTAALFTAGQAPAAQNEATPVVLHVDNYARIPPDLLTRAQAEAERIYAESGVQTVWLDGGAGRSRTVTARELRILLLDRDMAERKIAWDEVPPNVLGRAAYSTGRAYIFVDRIMEESARRECEAAIALGRVLAHEVGHLLLPRGGHSEEGIMRSRLDLRSDSAGTFTPDERTEMTMTLNGAR